MKQRDDSRRIFWIEPDRFDQKPNKSPWIEMADILSQHGYDVTIVTGYKKEKYLPINSRVNLVYLSMLNVPSAFRYVLLLRILVWMIWHGKRDDILILSPLGLLIAPLMRLFGFGNIHLDVRTLLGEPKSLKSWIDWFLSWKLPLAMLRNMAKGRSFITVPLKEAVEKEFNTQFSDYVLWQSGVNTARFHPMETTVNSDQAGIRIINILYHGSITKNRGIDRVVEAIAALDDQYKERVRLQIVGAGSEVDSLLALIQKKGLSGQIEFKGLMPYEKMPELIAQADYGIYPLPNLLAWNVSSPIKIFEYMACARPMILTPIPAHKSMVDGQDFVIWTKGDHVSDFVYAIRCAVDNLEKYQEAARMAPAFVVERYSWATQGDALAGYLSRKYN